MIIIPDTNLLRTSKRDTKTPPKRPFFFHGLCETIRTTKRKRVYEDLFTRKLPSDVLRSLETEKKQRIESALVELEASPEDVLALNKLMVSGTEAVRELAAQVLFYTSVDISKAVPTLTVVATSDEFRNVRASAAGALAKAAKDGLTDVRSVLPIIASTYEDQTWDVQRTSMSVVKGAARSGIDIRPALPAVVHALSDRFYDGRGLPNVPYTPREIAIGILFVAIDQKIDISEAKAGLMGIVADAAIRGPGRPLALIVLDTARKKQGLDMSDTVPEIRKLLKLDWYFDGPLMSCAVNTLKGMGIYDLEVYQTEQLLNSITDDIRRERGRQLNDLSGLDF